MEEKVNRQTIFRLIKALNDEEELSVISKKRPENQKPLFTVSSTLRVNLEGLRKR